MSKIFDYIFYRVSNLYITKWKDSQGMIYGIGVVSIMQLTHILFILLVFAIFSDNINEAIFKQREGQNFMHSGIIYPCLIVFAYNSFRYFKLMPFEKAKNKWSDEETDLKIKRGWLIIFYIGLSFGITIFLSIYRKYYF